MHGGALLRKKRPRERMSKLGPHILVELQGLEPWTSTLPV